MSLEEIKIFFYILLWIILFSHSLSNIIYADENYTDIYTILFPDNTIKLVGSYIKDIEKIQIFYREKDYNSSKLKILKEIEIKGEDYSQSWTLKKIFGKEYELQVVYLIKGRDKRYISERITVKPYFKVLEYKILKGDLILKDVNSVYRDKQNFLWFATKNGLIRYEERSGIWQRYIHFQGEVEKKIGNSWVKDSKDKRYLIDLTSSNIKDIIESKDNPNKILFITDNGIDLYDIETLKWEHFYKESKEYKNLIPDYSIIELSKNSFIMAMEGGILKCVKKDSVTCDKLDISESFVKTKENVILKNNHTLDGVWIGYNDKLFFYEKTKNKIILEYNTFGRKITSILESPAGVIWIGTERGLFYKDSDNNWQESYIENYIQFLKNDDEKYIWVGIKNGQLLRISDSNLEIFSYGNWSPLNEEAITNLYTSWDNSSIKYKYFDLPILLDNNSNLWISSLNGLYRFSNNHWEHYNSNNILPSDKVTTIFQDKKGGVFIGTDKGMAYYDITKNLWKKCDEGYFKNYITTFFESKDGSLWIGTSSGVIKCINIEIKDCNLFKGEDIIPHDFITKISEFDDEIWAGTADFIEVKEGDILPYEFTKRRGGVGVYNKKTKRWQVPYPFQNPFLFRGNYIIDFFKIDNRFFIASSKALISCERDKKKFFKCKIPEFFKTEPLFSLLAFLNFNNSILSGTTDGLLIFEPLNRNTPIKRFFKEYEIYTLVKTSNKKYPICVGVSELGIACFNNSFSEWFLESFEDEECSLNKKGVKIEKLINDNEKNIWVGALGKIIRFHINDDILIERDKKLKLLDCQKSSTNFSPLYSNLFLGKDNRIWIITNEGITIFEISSNKLKYDLSNYTLFFFFTFFLLLLFLIYKYFNISKFSIEDNYPYWEYKTIKQLIRKGKSSLHHIPKVKRDFFLFQFKSNHEKNSLIIDENKGIISLKLDDIKNFKLITKYYNIINKEINSNKPIDNYSFMKFSEVFSSFMGLHFIKDSITSTSNIWLTILKHSVDYSYANVAKYFPFIIIKSFELRKDQFAEINEIMEYSLIREYFMPSGTRFMVIFNISNSTLPKELIKTIWEERGIVTILFNINTLNELLLIKERGFYLVKRVIKSLREYDERWASTLSIYIVRGPVRGPKFYGRTKEINQVEDYLINGKGVIVVGGRKIGKTSLLRKVQERLEERGKFVIFIDCQSINSYEKFLSKLSTIVKKTIKDVEEGILFFKKELNKEIFLLLDEIDDLLEKEKNIFKELRTLSHDEQCKVMIVGESILYDDIQNPSSPFFNFLPYIILGYMNYEEGISLIEKPIEPLGIKIGESIEEKQKLIDKILEISSCHPAIIQSICTELLKNIDKKDYITKSDLDNFIKSLQLIEILKETLWQVKSPFLKVLISLIGDNELSYDEIKEKIDFYGISSMNIDKSLALLSKFYKLLTKENGRYKISNKIFAHFIASEREIILSNSLKELL